MRHKQGHGHPAVLQSRTCCRKQSQTLGKPRVVRQHLLLPFSLCFPSCYQQPLITTIIIASFLIPAALCLHVLPSSLMFNTCPEQWQPHLHVLLDVYLIYSWAGSAVVLSDHLSRPKIWMLNPTVPGAKFLSRLNYFYAPLSECHQHTSSHAAHSLRTLLCPRDCPTPKHVWVSGRSLSARSISMSLKSHIDVSHMDR